MALWSEKASAPGHAAKFDWQLGEELEGLHVRCVVGVCSIRVFNIGAFNNRALNMVDINVGDSSLKLSLDSSASEPATSERSMPDPDTVMSADSLLDIGVCCSISRAWIHFRRGGMNACAAGKRELDIEI
jgi:hypothetical protein